MRRTLEDALPPSPKRFRVDTLAHRSVGAFDRSALHWKARVGKCVRELVSAVDRVDAAQVDLERQAHQSIDGMQRVASAHAARSALLQCDERRANAQRIIHERTAGFAERAKALYDASIADAVGRIFPLDYRDEDNDDCDVTRIRELLLDALPRDADAAVTIDGLRSNQQQVVRRELQDWIAWLAQHASSRAIAGAEKKYAGDDNHHTTHA